MARPGRRPLTQAQKVFNAVKAGAQHGPDISKASGVPLKNVQPLLTVLRQRKCIRGYAGKMRAVKYPESRRGGRRAAAKGDKTARRSRSRVRPQRGR